MSSEHVRLAAVLVAVVTALGAIALPATALAVPGRLVLLVAALLCGVVAVAVRENGEGPSTPPGPPAVMPAPVAGLVPDGTTLDTSPVATAPDAGSVATAPATTQVSIAPAVSTVATAPDPSPVATAPDLSPVANAPDASPVAPAQQTSPVAPAQQTSRVAPAQQTSRVARAQQTSPDRAGRLGSVTLGECPDGTAATADPVEGIAVLGRGALARAVFAALVDQLDRALRAAPGLGQAELRVAADTAVVGGRRVRPGMSPGTAAASVVSADGVVLATVVLAAGLSAAPIAWGTVVDVTRHGCRVRHRAHPDDPGREVRPILPLLEPPLEPPSGDGGRPVVVGRPGA